MADYYSILARAVSGLDSNTPTARRRLYDRARSALLSEMQKARPPIAQSEIMVARMALDTAIGQVEADACLEALEKSSEHQNPIATASLILNRVSIPRRPSANQNVDRRWWRPFRWRSTRSMEVSEKKRTGRDTWLTGLLERASREEDEDYQDFTPKRVHDFRRSDQVRSPAGGSAKGFPNCDGGRRG
jgi:hypothetical protein